MRVTSSRRRGAAVVTAALLSLVASCGGSPAEEARSTPSPTRRPPGAPAITLLPAKPPAGFELDAVTLASNRGNPTGDNIWNGRVVTLYGDPDDSADGPLLFAYRTWGEDDAYTDAVLNPLSGCGADKLRETSVRSKHGQVESCGKTYVLAWDTNPEDFSEDSVGLVGRDMTPEQLARAADAMPVPKGGVGVAHRPLAIPASALPPGTTRLATGPMPAWARGDTFVWRKSGVSAGASERPELVLTVAGTYAGSWSLARAFVGGELRQIRGEPGAYGPVSPGLAPGSRELTWQEGGLLVGIRTNGVDESTTEAFIRSLNTVPIGKVAELQESFLKRPPESFLEPGEKVALTGHTNDQLWVLAVSADGKRRRGIVVEAGGVSATYRGRTGKPSRGQFFPAMFGYAGGDQVAVVQVHADVAKVVLTTAQDGKQKQVALTPGPSVFPDGSRYFGSSWLTSEQRIRRVTAYDADGNEISYQTSLAPYAKPHLR